MLPPDHTGTGRKAETSDPGERGVSAIPPKRENFYIISYDISVNRIRTKIADELKSYGRRVQYSVFECELTEKRFRELYGKLSVLLQQTQGEKTKQEELNSDGNEEKRHDEDLDEKSSNSIRVYRLCGTCVEQIRIIGIEKKKKEDSDIIII